METKNIITNKTGLKGVIGAIDRACNEWEANQKIKELQAKIDTVHSILSNWNSVRSDKPYTNILEYLKPTSCNRH